MLNKTNSVDGKKKNSNDKDILKICSSPKKGRMGPTLCQWSFCSTYERYTMILLNGGKKHWRENTFHPQTADKNLRNQINIIDNTRVKQTRKAWKAIAKHYKLEGDFAIHKWWAYN